MNHIEPLDHLPLWAFFLVATASIYLAIECGFQLGKYRRRAAETEKEGTIGPIVGATMGLMAFVLAFTFGLAATRYDARRIVVVDEANAIGTTYLRTGLLAEPHRTEVRELLKRYVTARLEVVQSGNIDQLLTESDDLHRRLWAHAEAVSQADPHSIAAGLFVQSLNETIDLHATRVMLAVRNRISIIIWAALFGSVFCSMLPLGYHAGLAGSRRSLAVAALVLTFSIILLLIADLDRPREGVIRVSQQALIDLQNSWIAAPGTTASP